ncbi:DUF2752 domain-containing protein [Nocardioides sp. 1609]|uniref:DUF2752 domain-containing protein n=1 Tax=Nocardioides sp. 1609 TaxID=2508327 RepID=UPI00143189CD|nr:DUF2752 domain-containing protein [Nocardioides sp. 1609]
MLATRTRQVLWPAATIGGLAAATVALALRDPHSQGSWGACPSAALGFACPGCGGLRAVNDLTHGRFLDAASSNVLLVAMIPVAVFLLGRWALDAWRGTDRPASALTTPLVVLLLIALAVFTVARNLPFGTWLAP